MKTYFLVMKRYHTNMLVGSVLDYNKSIPRKGKEEVSKQEFSNAVTKLGQRDISSTELKISRTNKLP